MPFIGAQPAVASGTLSTEGESGVVNFTATGKTLFVEDTSRVNQDLTADASPTFNNIKLEDGGEIQEGGGTSAITIDASGEVTKLGQDTPADGEVLGWDGLNSKAVWQAGFQGSAQFYGFRINDYNGDLLLDTGTGIGNSYITTFNVKVVVDRTLQNWGQNRFEIDGRDWDELNHLYFRLVAGASYRFDQSDSSNASHPLEFSTDLDGTTYNPNNTTVTTSGTPGTAGAYTQIDVPSNAPRVLYIKCGSHVKMGGRVEIIGNTNDDFHADATETLEYRKVYRVSEFDTSGLSYSIDNTGHLIVTI